MSVNKVLGYINTFVEHEGRHVIILANEKEIKPEEDYRPIKEKLIGITLEMQSVFELALETFIASIKDDHARAFLSSKKEYISHAYYQSGLNNLRILQQTMWNFERLFRVLEERHRNVDNGMAELLRLFFILSFEVRAGRIVAEDFKDWRINVSGSLYSASKPHEKDELSRDLNKDEPQNRIAQFLKRYPDSPLIMYMLSDKLLVDMIIKGKPSQI